MNKLRRHTKIIAEIGVNHNGDIEIAKQLVDVAADAGADTVKFQTFITEEEIIVDTPKAAYQQVTTDENESQFDMLKNLELSRDAHFELLDYCKQKNIEFMSSPFDMVSIDLLEELNVDTIKVPSGEITNVPYLRKIARLNKNLIISTGMAVYEEVEAALNVLTAAGTAKEKITVLHCTSEYPAPMDSINLLAMNSLASHFDVQVGYSDHTQGVEVSVAAVALGATIIEKHITLDNTMDGPDHAASMEPDELKLLVNSIRNIEKALGDGNKSPSENELATKMVVRKKIVANASIAAGEVLSESNLTTKRAPSGIDASQWDKVIGLTASKSYQLNDLVNEKL